MHVPYWPKFIGKNTNINRLDILSTALTTLNSPHKSIQNVIHISGTNGKGSTANFLSNILQETGLTTNLFTSPHLIHYNECFNLNGEIISDLKLDAIIETVRSRLGNDFDLTLFEASFLYAILAFQESPATFNIFETGLGGRIDPTNLLTNKVFNIFTPISLDHQEFLGPNIESVTCEKAYTTCKGAQTIIAPQPEIALGILKQFTLAHDMNYICYEDDYDFFLDNERYSFVDIKSQKIYEYDRPTLLGNHQLLNLSTALACTKQIINMDDHHENINLAISKTILHNRLQKMHHKLLNKKEYTDCEIWSDGAHNISGAKAIAAWLNERDYKYTFLLYGRTEHKDHLAFLTEFSRLADEIVFFEIADEARPCREIEFKESLSSSNLLQKTTIKSDLEDAIMHCFNTKKTPFRVITCGSLHIFRNFKRNIQLS